MIEWLEAHQLPCFFREIWGIQCPGCGFQTALLLLLKGNIQAAVVSWPGIVPLFAFGLLLIGRCCGIRKISAGFLKGTGFCCVATILIVYVFRFIKTGPMICFVCLFL